MFFFLHLLSQLPSPVEKRQHTSAAKFSRHDMYNRQNRMEIVFTESIFIVYNELPTCRTFNRESERMLRIFVHLRILPIEMTEPTMKTNKLRR
jgi:hypothetical protein